LFRLLAMAIDAKAVFANLVEKERLYGHHSAEGRAMRTLGRALDGWSNGGLSADDVYALCDQAIADWLKARLKVSAWSAPRRIDLFEAARAAKLITDADELCLQRLPDRRAESSALAAENVQARLQLCIEIVERHWS
jgi:hypothetical protein